MDQSFTVEAPKTTWFLREDDPPPMSHRFFNGENDPSRGHSLGKGLLDWRQNVKNLSKQTEDLLSIPSLIGLLRGGVQGEGFP